MNQKEQFTKSTHSKTPVVVVLGHIDHGKTTLLDFIRKSRIAFGEYGQITQHIGAYKIMHGNKSLTFIDTPGHEAFNNLRLRGTTIADLAVLVIDAQESVKPQTAESIKLIQKANIPFVVAINKMDLPNANPAKVQQDLLKYSVVVEEKGGNIACIPISAKTGTGVSDLLEALTLLADIKNLYKVKQQEFSAIVIESYKDKGKGCCASLLVEGGSLVKGDELVYEGSVFRIRALINDCGHQVERAFPGEAVEVLGFPVLPSVGSRLIKKGSSLVINKKVTDLASYRSKSVNSEEAILKVFVKTDKHGSLESVMAGLPEGVFVSETGIGDITEGDIEKAKTTGSVILGFAVKANKKVLQYADDEGVRIRVYTVIYKLFEELNEVVEILQMGPQKKIIGEAKILKKFELPSGIVAGCRVTSGRVAKGDKVQVIRVNSIVADNLKIASIRKEKEEETKIEKGESCGVSLRPFVDFEAGDMIQSYTLYEF
jgi:translation initiation factor IF-2